jgi:hypothetical protein
VTLRFTAGAVPLVFNGIRFIVAGTLVCLLVLGGCTRRPTHAPAEPRPPEPARTTGASVASGSTSFVVEDCPDAQKMDAKAAEGAMRKLIEPCHSVNAPAADFLATLVPGGRIEITSRGKDGAEGVVPVCVVKNRLTHSVALKQRCTFNVKLEPAAAVAPAASSSAQAPPDTRSR